MAKTAAILARRVINGAVPDPSPADRLWWYRDVRQSEPAAPRDRWWWLRREHTQDALACLTLSALCFSQARTETLFLADFDFYSRRPLGPPTLLALIFNLLAVVAVGVLCCHAIRRTRRQAWRRVGAVAAVAALLISLSYARLAYETLDQSVDAIGRQGVAALVVVMVAGALVWPARALRAIRGIALVGSPLAVLALVHALWMFLELAAGPTWRRVEPTMLTEPAPSLRRVVWIVFEELDQRITFEARPAGLELPELDRLRRESLYAGAARPPAGTTEISMPALITGRRVVAVAPSSPNELELTLADGKTARWSAPPNVFSRARVLGYDTALIGWHLPYPRILGSSLGRAEWRPSLGFEQARGDTFDQAFQNQWASLVPPVHVRRLFAQRISELGSMALRTATDGRFGLVLLHLPIPQPPAIYDRDTGSLTAWNFNGAGGGYLDNLALVDRVIGDLRRGLDRARLGDRTWLVVSADRWWRGSKTYDGETDYRVPFIVHPPDGGRAIHADVAFNTLATHDLVLAILRGSISDTGDAAAWLERQPATPPREYTREGRPIY